MINPDLKNVIKGWDRNSIASKIANDLPHASYVNLGIGMPELVSQHIKEDREIIYHSENGLLGMGPTPNENEIDLDLINAGKQIKGSRVLLLGITFKENCPDIRNTKIIDVFKELTEFGLIVDIYDPEANTVEVKNEYDVDLINNLDNKYDGILLAVAHQAFTQVNLSNLKKDKSAIVFDLKGFLHRNEVNARL